MIYLERIPFVERADPEVLEIANTSFQCVVDIVLLAIPIVPLLRMHLPKSKRGKSTFHLPSWTAC